MLWGIVWPNFHSETDLRFSRFLGYRPYGRMHCSDWMTSVMLTYEADTDTIITQPGLVYDNNYLPTTAADRAICKAIYNVFTPPQPAAWRPAAPGPWLWYSDSIMPWPADLVPDCPHSSLPIPLAADSCCVPDAAK